MSLGEQLIRLVTYSTNCHHLSTMDELIVFQQDLWERGGSDRNEALITIKSMYVNTSTLYWICPEYSDAGGVKLTNNQADSENSNPADQITDHWNGGAHGIYWYIFWILTKHFDCMSHQNS